MYIYMYIYIYIYIYIIYMIMENVRRDNQPVRQSNKRKPYLAKRKLRRSCTVFDCLQALIRVPKTSAQVDSSER